MAHSFHINHSHMHMKWNNALTPIISVSSGSTISFDLLDGAANQLTDQSTITDVENLDPAKADPAFGPVYIEDAQPGDVLKVEFISLKPASYGWTAILPSSFGFGLLADEYPDAGLKIWDLSTGKDYAVFKEGIHIPIRPFLGVVGVAPEQTGEFSTIPPYETGGNIDCKYITQGSTLYLPVKVPGALFSCGDGHAAQGDGEVCGTAIETPMKAEVKLSIEKGKSWVTSPHYETGPEAEQETTGLRKGTYAALGIDSDLREASRKALRGLIAWLVGEKGLTREEGYLLSSVAANLKIAEAVDMPNYAVACNVLDKAGV
ncbi:hypothetical protein ACMFMF_011064 [Clarireedia jacksonii]